MVSRCIPPDEMRAFLAGDLAPEDERSVGDHLDGCGRCERLAAELSDDRQVRELAAASRRRHGQAFIDADPAIEDLRRQLSALALYDSVLASEDTNSGLEGDPKATSIERLSVLGAGGEFAWPRAEDGESDDAPPRLTHLGRYQILKTIGGGTFGVVYLAVDQRLHRRVAVKVARASVLIEPELRRRFFREAEALARLAHPNIVPVYEADEINGLCFLAVAYCEGPTLDTWLQEQPGPLPPHLAARLLLLLANAVEHAHAHGILHRDIKPGNILLEPAEDGGELPVVPRLTDFGLAKLAEEKNTATLSGLVLGTPQYMAPEQAAGHLERIGPATDVYALGAVLYQMLAGQAPINGNSSIDTLRRLLIDEPPPVRSVARAVPDDLDAIVMKCLEKSPAGRYATARELAADLQRFLYGLPTVARPLNAGERAARWVRRNPTLTTLVALLLTVVLLAAGLIRYAHRLSNSELAAARERARSAELVKQVESGALSIAQREYAEDVRRAARETAKGNTAHAVTALRSYLPGQGKPELRSLSWHYLWGLSTQAHLGQANAGTEIYQIRLSPDERELAAACQDGLLRLYEANSLHLQAALPIGQGEINGVAYSPDGRQAATAGDDGTLRVLDLATRRELRKIDAHADKAYGVVFYDAGRKLASCGTDELIRLWDAASGQPIGALRGHANAVEAIALSPDGKLLASASSDRTAILWDIRAGRRLHTLEGHQGRLTSVCFSPDGQRLATGALDRTIALWDAASGRRLTEQPCLDDAQSVAFSGDGQQLYAGKRSGTLRNFHIVPPVPSDPRVKLALPALGDAWAAHGERVWCVEAATRQRIFYTAGRDGLIRRWPQQPRDRVQRVIPATPDDLFADVKYSADGKSLFVLRESSGVTILDAATLQPKLALSSKYGAWRSLEILQGRDEVAAGNAHGQVAIWNWKTGSLRRLLAPDDQQYTVADLAYSPATGLLAVLLYEADHVRLYDPQSGRLVARFPTSNHNALAFSPDGRLVAVDSLNQIFLYDVRGGPPLHVLRGHASTINSLAFSPDSRTLASGSNDRTVRLWSVGGDSLAIFTEYYAGVSQVGFTPDGVTLVSTDDAGAIKLVHLPTRSAILDIPAGSERLQSLAMSPDNRQVAVIRDTQDILLLGPSP